MSVRAIHVEPLHSITEADVTLMAFLTV
jgi:hypothetical protein